MKKRHGLAIILIALSLCFAGCASYQPATGCPQAEGIIGVGTYFHPRVK